MVGSVPPSDDSVEHSVWIKTWGPSLPDPNNLPPGVNTINLFEGKIDQVGGQWTIDGFGFNPTQLKAYVDACHAKGISVKISLGGAGGQAAYNNTWDQIGAGNVQDVAKGLADFCKANNIDGIDFDYEEQKDQTQRQLVGQLIGSFKDEGPELQASVCTNASSYWSQDLSDIMDNAKTKDGSCAVDRIYVMSYDYNMGSSSQTLASDEQWMTSWASFGAKYGIKPDHISVGVDPSDHTNLTDQDRKTLLEFAHDKGFSTAVWDTADYNEGQYTQQVLDDYNSGNDIDNPQ